MPSKPLRPRSPSGKAARSAAGGRQSAELAAALRCHKTGDLRGAERLYRSFLSRNPKHGEALNLLGVIAMQTGRPSEAVGLVGRAIQADSSKAEFHYNLGMAHLGLAGRDEAIKCFRRAVSLRPTYADALVNLGNLLLNAGELDEAEGCYRKAAKLVPSSPVVQNNLGTVLMAREAAKDAAPCFRQALKLKPDYAEAHNGLGTALYTLGKFDEALGCFQAALGCNPRYAQAHGNLGNVYFDEDRLEDAERSLREALALRPDYVQAQGKLVQVHLELGDFETALRICDDNLAGDPESQTAWAAKADVLDRMGRTREASDIVRGFAVDGPPPLGMIRLYAGMASREQRQAEAIAEIEGILAQAGHRDAQARMLRFTLGRLHDELGRFDEAFAHYQAGNRLRPTPYDPAQTATVTDRIVGHFSAETLAGLARADNRSERPVFIVGMPRSGTSLVEQILSCHRDVHAAGELRDLGKLAVQLGYAFQPEDDGGANRPRSDRDSLAAAANRYLERLGALAGEARRVTDKMPYNFLHLGLIALLFPRARVIHCLREPLDTCLSCYFQNFAAGNFFSFDLRHAGLYYRQYERLMAHWQGVLDLPMLEVRYEDHVAEPERICRGMLDFLGLDWDPACLRFHESRRYTKTASREQVRRPIYSSSSGRWRNYARHLGPLKEALFGPAPSG